MGWVKPETRQEFKNAAAKLFKKKKHKQKVILVYKPDLKKQVYFWLELIAGEGERLQQSLSGVT